MEPDNKNLADAGEDESERPYADFASVEEAQHIIRCYNSDSLPQMRDYAVCLHSHVWGYFADEITREYVLFFSSAVLAIVTLSFDRIA
jgi:hypothetical protein